MPSRSAPAMPLLRREARALVSRWHLWAGVAALGAVQAALCLSATPLEGTRPLLLYGLAAAWLCALPVAVACAAADDRSSANLALLLQLGHSITRVTFGKLVAAMVGAGVLALPALATAALLAARSALPSISGVALATLALGALLMVVLALVIAAVVADTGWAAACTMLVTLALLWLDVDGRALELLAAANTGVLPRSSAALLVVVGGTLFTLAAVWASPTASGERRTLRSLVALAVGGALGAAASRVTGTLGDGYGVDVRARAAEAAAIGELPTTALLVGALVVVGGLVLAWLRR
ncbi:MAG: hypothetical protein IT383_25540 [Deltaproteobacteria bacterium]|nr:hypothetical protein [Deltaproteobacteria bacterium]